MLPKILTTDYKDFKINLFGTSDVATRVVMFANKWDDTLIDVSQKILKHADTPIVLDIGANIGLYSLEVADYIKSKGGKVYSFEPQRIIFQQFCSNIFINRQDNIIPHHMGIGDTEGVVEIPAYDYNHVENTGAISLLDDMQNARNMELKTVDYPPDLVNIRTLDNFPIDGIVNLIKIDVEGMEINVLRGAHKFLAAHHFPYILFEAWSEEWYAPQRKALLQEFDSLGYHVVHGYKDEYLAVHKTRESLEELDAL